jgi:hypothetical protein
MRLFDFLATHRPSEGLWLVIGLIALFLVVALPAAAWSSLEAAAYGRFD